MRTILLLCVMNSIAWGQGSGITVVGRGDDSYARKWALIVGINYANAQTVSKLDNPQNDALAISEILKKSYGFECEVLLGTEKGREATASAIKSKLKKLEKQIGEKDCFLFYFAGHGAPRDDMPLLYPADVEVDGDVVNTLQASEVIRTEFKALHSLYVFDSCYSGQIANLDRFPPLNRMKRRDGDAKFESRSIQVLTSSASNQTAKDGANGHSPFARALMGGFTARVGATDLHKHISRQLHGQETQFLSLIPDQTAASGGDFYFVGKAPESALSSLVYQTLPGSYATLAGSPISRSWFDELPWLTPAVRLMMDQEVAANPELFPSLTGLTSSAESVSTPTTKQLVEQAGKLIDNGKVTVEENAHIVYDRLKQVEGERNRGTVIREVFAGIKTRDARTSGIDLHTLALLEAARLNTLVSKPQEKEILEVHKLYEQSVQAYETERKRGLHARCLADHALWLLDVAPDKLMSEARDGETRYKLAFKYFEEAQELIQKAPGTERFQIELYSGAAYAMRQRAKRLVAEPSANDMESRKNKREALIAWKASGESYDKAFTAAVTAKLSTNDPTLAYLNQRVGWLRMDLWNVNAASQSFAKAAEIVPSESSDLVTFLSYASSAQGLAMAKRLAGESAKDDLAKIKTRLMARISKSKSGESDWLLLQERLGNAIERLADCDFLKGGTNLIESSTEFKRGLEFCNSWRESIETGAEEKKVNEQELRFLCKLIVVSTLLNDDSSRKHYEARYQELESIKSQASGVLKVLCDLADAFSAYGRSKFDDQGMEVVQRTLDKIRAVVQQSATAALDRESAELLLSISSSLSIEQQRMDARTRLELLPKEPSGKIPADMPKSVRRQYDGVVLMLGRTYSGRVPPLEFDEFRRLVHAVRQSQSSNEDLLSPFLIFFHPLDGANGLVLISYGDSDPLRRGGEVCSLDFGWKSVPRHFSGELQTIIEKATLANPKLLIEWTDSLLTKEGFNVPCPVTNLAAGLK